MQFKEVVRLFGGPKKISKILDVSVSNIYSCMSGVKNLSKRWIPELKAKAIARSKSLLKDSESLKEWVES